MKIAICKIGANITFSRNNKSAANADILYALRTIGTKENEITVVTHKTRNTYLPKQLKFQEILDTKTFDNFDCVLVFNGSINFFGGVIDPNLIALYKALHNTSVRIMYIHTDGAMWFSQLWPLIHKREWAKDIDPESLHVDPEQITVITQGYNKEKMQKLARDKFMIPGNMVSFNWASTILTGAKKRYVNELYPFEHRQYSLAFGGATRNTYKRKKIEKYYDSPYINTFLFGNLRGVKLRHTKIHPKVSHQAMINVMRNARATVIIGDEFYNDNFLTLRMYEGILAGCAVFVDRELDPRQLLHGPESSRLYISSVKELEVLLRYTKLEEVAKVTRDKILNSYDDDSAKGYLNALLGDLL